MSQFMLGVVICTSSSDPKTVKILDQSEARTTCQLNPSNADHVTGHALKEFPGKSREITHTQKKSSRERPRALAFKYNRAASGV